MNDVERYTLHHLAAITIEQVTTQFGNGKTGGYLYILPSNKVIMHLPIGVLDESKIATQQMISREKAQRLAQHERHWLSSESREVEREKYGGAARGTTKDATGKSSSIIISLSGLPEPIDEAYVLALMIGMKWLTYEQAFERLHHSPIADFEAFKEIHLIVMMLDTGGRLML